MLQMSPLNWLILFIIFSITFIVFNTLNYFSFTPNSNNNKSKIEIKSNYLNWKW